jgi:protein-L-isoaspartate(D-aspartate) O-methyltransferase
MQSNESIRRIEDLRFFYASLITANAGVPRSDSALREAFATIPRERFLGEGPWKVVTLEGYIETPSADPAFLYQDVVVALKEEDAINNGQPSLHALCLAALRIKEGELVLHIGAGGGYYTAILSKLSGPSGSVFAYEIDQDLSERALRNLADLENVTVFHRSGSEGSLPNCDVIYVSAGATEPLDLWVDALRPGGRLLFPLTPTHGAGGMLLITHVSGDSFDARILCQATFIPCAGARDEETARKIADAFRRGNFHRVRSLRRGTSPDQSCWCSGRGWWLSCAHN